MPKIELKPSSPEYADSRNQPQSACEMPGCNNEATHRAPRDRGLNEYHSFCFEHVSEYNRAWNFFEGMSTSDIEEQMRKNAYWDRETKKRESADSWTEEDLIRKARETYTGREQPKEEPRYGYSSTLDYNTPEGNAMKLMGLQPPLTKDKLKTRYKELAKKFHPDLNKGDKNAEERLKEVNMAYTILKVAHEKFEETFEEKV